MHRVLTCKPRRNVEHRLIDKDRHGIEIRCERLQSKALRLERYGTTSCKRIVKCRNTLRVKQDIGLGMMFVKLTNFSPRPAYLLACSFDHNLVSGVFP